MSYKICFLTHDILERHATIKRAFGMAGPLLELGHRVSICLEDHESNREAMQKLVGATPLWYQPAPFAGERRQKTELVAGQRFDAVHICGLGFRNSISRAANPSGVTIMDHVELESSLVNTPKTRRAAQYAIEAWSLAYYQAHVVASAYLRDLWHKRSAQWKLDRDVLYLQFAYDSRWLDRLEHTTGELVRRRFHGKKIVFYMGGFYKAYGCYEMLDSLELLLRTRSDVAAVLCGAGPEYVDANEYARQKGLSESVVMPGFVKEAELMEYLAAADVLISPLQDTVADRARCPSKLYEYLVTRRPIVTCRIGENGQVLGDSGYYYQPQDTKSMAEALERALKGERQDYRLEEHTWMARTQCYVQWLDELRDKHGTACSSSMKLRS